MKADEAALQREKRQHRREIAVADERLARAARLVGVEQRQQLRAAVAAADARSARQSTDRASAASDRRRAHLGDPAT